jgi:hypothetical protein
MADALRNHEIAAALKENSVASKEVERSMRALATSAHRGFALLEELIRDVYANGDRITALERQVAQLRSTIETLVALDATRQDLLREDQRLERERLEAKRAEDEISGAYEITKLEHETKRVETRTAAARDAARGLVAFLQTRAGWGVLLLCGMVVAWAMGTERFSDLLSNLVALSKGWRR